MYIYEGHMGGLYTSDRPLDYEELYCEQCGDSDWCIGYAETKAEAWDLLKDVTNINGSGGWVYEYVVKFLNENWNDDFNIPMHEYIQFNCPECSSPLEVWSEEVLESYSGNFDSFDYERINLIRHCDNCHCDWENEWWIGNGDIGETQLRRKFWG